MPSNEPGSHVASEIQKSIKFSPEVAASLVKHEKAFSDFLSRLDQACTDIKNLEQLLTSYGICVPFRYKAEYLGRYVRNKGLQSESRFERAAFLCWDECEEKFRLIYNEVELTQHLNEQGSYYTDESFENGEITFSRPLIETKAKIRLGMQACLPEFIRALSTHLELMGDRTPF